MNDTGDLGTITEEGAWLTMAQQLARVLAHVGWFLAAVGYFGPWIAHKTAALTLSGVDMGEFVKFLPSVLEGSLQVARQVFYLPPAAIVFGVAMLTCSRELEYSQLIQVLALAFAVPVSLQLLPPAWSPYTLMSAEFRLQTVVMGTLWLLLAGTCLWGRLSIRLLGILTGFVALAAATLSIWQFGLARPAIVGVYSTPTHIGWGFFVCMIGLAAMTATGMLLAWRGPKTQVALRL